jgi:NAD(P)-dependent dehydrogenase (short-subunit alcohol dehydrogenase family)
VPHAVIAGASSGIGSALAAHLHDQGWQVSGTARRTMPADAGGVEPCISCDFASVGSVDGAAREIASGTPPWDLLVLAPGTMRPIGNFIDVDMDQWADSLQVNLINQLRFVHGLLTHAAQGGQRMPLCVFLAGGGTNSAPVAFSAYTVSKIALIKATELLDAEMPNIKFTILGPGWVRTAMHEETLTSTLAPEAVVRETRRRLKSGDFIEMNRVMKAVDWLLAQPKSVVGGRNFSVEGDPFDQEAFADFLERQPSALKLRRSGNEAYWSDHEQ